MLLFLTQMNPVTIQAHTWSNLELLESGPGRRPVPRDDDEGSGSEEEEEEEEVGEVGEQVINLEVKMVVIWRIVIKIYWMGSVRK